MERFKPIPMASEATNTLYFFESLSSSELKRIACCLRASGGRLPLREREEGGEEEEDEEEGGEG